MNYIFGFNSMEMVGQIDGPEKSPTPVHRSDTSIDDGQWFKFKRARVDVCTVLVHSWTHMSGKWIDWCPLVSMHCGT